MDAGENGGDTIYAKDIIYNCLKKHGVTTAFIYSGGSIMPIIDTLYHGDINYYVNSHEQNCGHALTGFSKYFAPCCIAILPATSDIGVKRGRE